MKYTITPKTKTHTPRVIMLFKSCIWFKKSKSVLDWYRLGVPASPTKNIGNTSSPNPRIVKRKWIAFRKGWNLTFLNKYPHPEINKIKLTKTEICHVEITKYVSWTGISKVELKPKIKPNNKNGIAKTQKYQYVFILFKIDYNTNVIFVNSFSSTNPFKFKSFNITK